MRAPHSKQWVLRMMSYKCCGGWEQCCASLMISAEQAKRGSAECSPGAQERGFDVKAQTAYWQANGGETGGGRACSFVGRAPAMQSMP